jgi:hypothetical protein
MRPSSYRTAAEQGASLIGERGHTLVPISYAQANGLFTEEQPRAIIHREFTVVCFPEASIVAGGSHDRARTHRGQKLGEWISENLATWLNFVMVPVAVAIITFLLNQAQKQRELNLAEKGIGKDYVGFG